MRPVGKGLLCVRIGAGGVGGLGVGRRRVGRQCVFRTVCDMQNLWQIGRLAIRNDGPGRPEYLLIAQAAQAVGAGPGRRRLRGYRRPTSGVAAGKIAKGGYTGNLEYLEYLEYLDNLASCLSLSISIYLYTIP